MLTSLVPFPSYRTREVGYHHFLHDSHIFYRWSPRDTLAYCIARTECKLIILDPERADVLEPLAEKLIKDSRSNGILVFETVDLKRSWRGMEDWDATLAGYKGDVGKVLNMDLQVSPEDNATILFTSGSSSLTYMCFILLTPVHPFRYNRPPKGRSQHSKAISQQSV